MFHATGVKPRIVARVFRRPTMAMLASISVSIFSKPIMCYKRLDLVPDRAAALNVKSAESRRKRLADHASSLDKTGQTSEKIVKDSNMRLAGCIAFPYPGKSGKNDEAGRRR